MKNITILEKCTDNSRKNNQLSAENN